MGLSIANKHHLLLYYIADRLFKIIKNDKGIEMQENSPYAAPEADITTQNLDETYQPQVFAIKGRIGRLRYLAYVFGLYALVMVIVAVGAAILGAAGLVSDTGSMITMVAIGLVYLALIVFGMVLVVRRLNDLDKTGWLSLVLFIPIVGALWGLYLVFAAGTDGVNKYGPAPSENSMWVKIAGLALPIIAVIGIVAAIALPAYQEYVARASGL